VRKYGIRAPTCISRTTDSVDRDSGDFPAVEIFFEDAPEQTAGRLILRVSIPGARCAMRFETRDSRSSFVDADENAGRAGEGD